MPLDPRTASTFTDFAGLARLKAAAHADKKAATASVARQFETVFTEMMLKSMRSASLGSGILDSQQSKAYRDLADQQLALTLSTRGKGLGLAAVIERQLAGHPAAQPVAAPSAPSRKAATPLHATDAAALNPLPARPAAMQRLATDPAAQAAPDAGASIAERAAAIGEGLRPALRATFTAIDSASDGALHRIRDAMPANAVEFVQTMLPHAKAAAEKLGVSVRAVLAQAALETGWGRHLPRARNGASSNNLFGIKAGSGWAGARTRVATTEYENGVAVRRVDSFRAYDSPSGAFSDYADLIANNPRYAAALGTGEDVHAFGAALQRAGYATDPSYAAKLARIADSAPMRTALAALKNSGAPPTS